jgi:hypothetical protein
MVLRDLLPVLVVVLAFAVAVTDHVAIVAGLAARRPRWHAPLALVIVPLAPFWAYRAGMRARAAIWVVAALTYATALALAR